MQGRTEAGEKQVRRVRKLGGAATTEWPDGTPWRLALLLVLARTTFVAALLGEYVLAFAFLVSFGLIVLDLVDLHRARTKLRRA